MGEEKWATARTKATAIDQPLRLAFAPALGRAVTPAAWRFGGTPERSTLVGWSCIPYITQAPPHVYGYGYWFRYRYVVAHDPALLHCECDRSVGVMDGGS